MSKASAEDENFDRYESPGFVINLAARLLAQRMAEALKPLAVAPAYLPVLFSLASMKVSTQSELAELAAIEQPTMAMTLRRMERDGMIERSPDLRDKRLAIVRLTVHGAALVPKVESIAKEVNAVATQDLGADGKSLLALLEKVIANLRE